MIPNALNVEILKQQFVCALVIRKTTAWFSTWPAVETSPRCCRCSIRPHRLRWPHLCQMLLIPEAEVQTVICESPFIHILLSNYINFHFPRFPHGSANPECRNLGAARVRNEEHHSVRVECLRFGRGRFSLSGRYKWINGRRYKRSNNGLLVFGRCCNGVVESKPQIIVDVNTSEYYFCFHSLYSYFFIISETIESHTIAAEQLYLCNNKYI